jgi:hypothetical protein
MRSTAKAAMKWINVKIVEKWYVMDVEHFAVANFVDVDCVEIVLQPVEGKLFLIHFVL